MTTVEIPGSWERQRACLSHDRMKNQLLPMTSRLCQILDGKVESLGFVDEFGSVRLAEIRDLCREIEGLLSTAEEAASPRAYFSLPPLCQCSLDTLAWLPQAVHEKWLREKRVRSRIKSTQMAIGKVFCACLDMQGALREKSPNSRTVARVLQSALLRLADCLSDLGALRLYRF